MRTREYVKLVPKYGPVIEAIATKLSRRCPWFRDDLIQEGHFRLQRLQLTRQRFRYGSVEIQAPRKPDPYIRAAIKYAMIDHLRRLRPEMVDCTIEQAFRWGYALSQDSGELRLQWAKEGWPQTCEMFL